jgi:hypothetical protein
MKPAPATISEWCATGQTPSRAAHGGGGQGRQAASGSERGCRASVEPGRAGPPRGISPRKSVPHRWNSGRRVGTNRLGRARGGKNLPHGDGILEGADHSQPPATAGTRQHVDRERASHEARPRRVARAARPMGSGGARAAGGGPGNRDLGDRSAIAHDLSASARMWRQHAVVEEQVDLGPGRQRGQPRQELQGLEHQGVVPSCQARFSLTATRPSVRRCSRSCASGGRSRYRQRCSSRARLLGRTRMSAWRSNPSR